MEGILFTNNTFVLSATTATSTTSLATYVSTGLTIFVAIQFILLVSPTVLVLLSIGMFKLAGIK